MSQQLISIFASFMNKELTDRLTNRKIFLFWGPLALTWLMMAFEQPFLIAFKFNLAAFGIAGSFAMIIEAPIIMLLSASTALVTGRNSYRKLKEFTDILNAVITGIHLIMIIPSVFNFIAIDIMEVPENVAELAYTALVLFIPWSASIGYRRFYQGIIIRKGFTRMVTYGTLIRFSVITIVGLILYFAGIPGAYVGAAAMSSAVLLEAIATRIMVSASLKEVLGRDDPENSNMSMKAVIRFYAPLAMTSVLSMGIHPFVTFFLSRSYMAVESLAVLPVAGSLVFIFRSAGLSFQEVNIALMGNGKHNFDILKRFAISLGIALTFSITVVAFTPLANLWFINVSGLTMELADLSYLPLKIMIFLPALTLLMSFQRSTLVLSGNTGPISVSTAIELVVIITSLIICTSFFNLTGVVAAAISFVAGRVLSTLYLLPIHASIVKNWSSGK
jgi:progressive ankylosis protein